MIIINIRPRGLRGSNILSSFSSHFFVIIIIICYLFFFYELDNTHVKGTTGHSREKRGKSSSDRTGVTEIGPAARFAIVAATHRDDFRDRVMI